MPISEKQRAERKNHLGSSDMAAILGIDPWKSSFDLYLEKTGQLVETPDEENPAMQIGNLLENGILDWAEIKLGKLNRNVTIPAPFDLPIVVNVDAIVIEGGRPVDAKSTSQRGIMAETWGEDGTDEIPDHTIVQTQTHLLATESDVCYVPVLLGGHGLKFSMYEVKRNEDLIDTIKMAAVKFWEKNVKAMTPPEKSEPHLEIVKRIRRQPNKIIDVPATLVQGWLDAKEAAKAADDAKEAAQATLLAALGDAEGANSPLGALTYMEQKRAAFEVKATSFRVLRLKAKKG